jgi:ribulose bisphosphate carboxylase small subunit
MANQAALNLENQETAFESVLTKIEHCLHKGCVVRIEHAPKTTPRFTPWLVWETPGMYNGDINQVLNELDNCHKNNPRHFVRITIEDYNFNSRFSFVVHSPDRPT